jgi:hypothetical protein
MHMGETFHSGSGASGVKGNQELGILPMILGR